MSFIPLGVLAASGGGATPAFESIATVTASGGETSLAFNSIPQTYKSLQIRFTAKDSYSGVADFTYVPMVVNTSNSWYTHFFYGDGGSATVEYLGLCRVGVIPNSASALANIFGSGIIDVTDYASSTNYKTFKSINGMDRNASGGRISLISNLRKDTSAITSLSFTADTTWAAGTKFSLYGIKG